MNKVILMGRLTRDPEVRYSQNGPDPMAVARYTLAVDRRGGGDSQQTADFIPCVAFGRAGEFAEKYFRKGQRVAIVGRIQTGSYTNREGQKVYTTDVVVENQEFADSKRNDDQGGSYQSGGGYDDQGGSYQNGGGGYDNQNNRNQNGGGGNRNGSGRNSQNNRNQNGSGGNYQNNRNQNGGGRHDDQGGYYGPAGDGFMNIPDGIDEELPFN